MAVFCSLFLPVFAFSLIAHSATTVLVQSLITHFYLFAITRPGSSGTRFFLFLVFGLVLLHATTALSYLSFLLIFLAITVVSHFLPFRHITFLASAIIFMLSYILIVYFHSCSFFVIVYTSMYFISKIIFKIKKK